MGADKSAPIISSRLDYFTGGFSMRALSILIQTIIGGIGIGSLYALVALGTSMIYRSMGLINFANGSIYMVGTYFGMIWYTGMISGLQLPYWLSFILGVLLCAGLGLILERIVRRLADVDLRNMLIGMIGLGFILDNIMIIIFGAEGFAVKAPLPTKPIIIAGIRIMPQNILLITVAAVVISLQVFLTKSKMGKAMRASAMDRDIARTMGIHVNLTNAITFAIGFGLSAAAGILAAPIVYVNPAMGSAVGTKAFAGAVLGGLGNIPGAILGGVSFGVIEALSSGYLSSQYTKGISFIVVLVVLMFMPSGILGEKQVDKV
jgi:branched-chain amino acid transport system permease protein